MAYSSHLHNPFTLKDQWVIASCSDFEQLFNPLLPPSSLTGGSLNLSHSSDINHFVKLQSPWPKALELRLDNLLLQTSVEALLKCAKSFKERFQMPLLLTYRSFLEGGWGQSKQRGLVDYLPQFIPIIDALDIELSNPNAPDLIDFAQKQAQSQSSQFLQIVLSCHDFDSFPTQEVVAKRVEIFKQLKSLTPYPHWFKWAVVCHNSKQAQKALNQLTSDTHLKKIVLVMGKYALEKRAQALKVGSMACFVRLGQIASAPNQPSLEELIHQYQSLIK